MGFRWQFLVENIKFQGILYLSMWPNKSFSKNLVIFFLDLNGKILQRTFGHDFILKPPIMSL
jgi:hypothetical protein